MRKNAVNNTLIPIDGGVCAPKGFKAGGYHCGISAYGTLCLGEGAFSRDIREDLSLILADKRCSAACVFTAGNTCGAPVTLAKKHIQTGVARAIFCNAGIANVLQENGERAAREICDVIAKKAGISAEDIIIASTGVIGQKYPLEAVINSLDGLIGGLGDANENSLSAARGIMTTDKTVKQLSFAFSLGDYPCKIGAIFKGNTQVCPNMATTLCFLTTDVNISPQMLQKSLTFATNEGFNLLNIDGVSSPNDTVCVLANGEAGNYKITCADSEYKKFCRVLCDVVAAVCKKIALESGEKLLTCKVTGAKSKRAAYAAAKSVASSLAVKEAVAVGEIPLNAIFSVLCGTGETLRLTQTQIFVCFAEKEILLAEEGKRLPLSPLLKEQIIAESEVEILVKLRDGNYAATAYGCALH